MKKRRIILYWSEKKKKKKIFKLLNYADIFLNKNNF
jgi:hypothetical protein